MKKCERTSKTAANVATKPTVANSVPSSICATSTCFSANAAQKVMFHFSGKSGKYLTEAETLATHHVASDACASLAVDFARLSKECPSS